MRGSLSDRFWAKVQKTDNCWVWTGAIIAKAGGYGTINASKDRGILRVHRVSWELHFGAIPDGLSVLHRCDNPPCVRPDHLFLGSQQDNVADMMAKGRCRTRPPMPGIVAGRLHAKMSLEIAAEVRAEYFRGGTTLKRLAAKHGVHHETVRRIVHGRSWVKDGAP